MKERNRIIRGREITQDDIKIIRETIDGYYNNGRTYISRQICHRWKWYQANGQTKDMACRYIMLALEKDGLIRLPPSGNSQNNTRRSIKKIMLEENPLSGTVKDHPLPELRLLKTYQECQTWNRIIHSYHYQGYQVMVGQNCKYIAYIAGKPAACLGWGSAAWSVAARDKWIGWDKETKDKNLHRVVNNIRFLILPWIKIKNLASYLLSLNIGCLRKDWRQKYGEDIYLLETFVEKDRFKGTCYRAGNWTYLGETKGSAKKGSLHIYHGSIKDIYVYPLYRDFRDKIMER